MVRWVRIMLGGHSSCRIKMNRRGCLSSTTSSCLPESSTKLCDAPVSTKATVSRPFTVTPACVSPARLTHSPLNRIQQLPPLGSSDCINTALRGHAKSGFEQMKDLISCRSAFFGGFGSVVLPSGLTNLFFDEHINLMCWDLVFFLQRFSNLNLLPVNEWDFFLLFDKVRLLRWSGLGGCFYREVPPNWRSRAFSRESGLTYWDGGRLWYDWDLTLLQPNIKTRAS